MKLPNCEVVTFGVSVVVVLSSVVSMIVQEWVNIPVEKDSSVILGPYRTCVVTSDHRHCVSNQQIFVGSLVLDAPFLLAMAALTSVSLVANMISFIFIAAFASCVKLKLQGVRLGVLISSLTGWLFGLVCSATWIIKWLTDGASILNFGPGLWVALIAAWLSLTVAYLSTRLKPQKLTE